MTESNELRLLPWSGSDDKPCYLSSDPPPATCHASPTTPRRSNSVWDLSYWPTPWKYSPTRTRIGKNSASWQRT